MFEALVVCSCVQCILPSTSSMCRTRDMNSLSIHFASAMHCYRRPPSAPDDVCVNYRPTICAQLRVRPAQLLRTMRHDDSPFHPEYVGNFSSSYHNVCVQMMYASVCGHVHSVHVSGSPCCGLLLLRWVIKTGYALDLPQADRITIQVDSLRCDKVNQLVKQRLHPCNSGHIQDTVIFCG